MSPQHRAFTWAPGLPTHTQGPNQQRLRVGQKKEDTDERKCKEEDEEEKKKKKRHGEDVKKDYTARDNEREGDKIVQRN